MAMKTINGKIIRILDTKTVIINLGTKDGITNASYFNILGEPEDIIDPFTKDVLGRVNVVKAKLKTSHADEKFTIASTKWIQHNLKFTNTLNVGFGNLFEEQEVDEGELKVENSEIEPWKAKSETPVKVGDVVTVEIEIEESSENNSE